MAFTHILYLRDEHILKIENGREIIRPEAEKEVKALIVKAIFYNRILRGEKTGSSLDKKEAKKIMKAFLYPTNVVPSSIHIYNKFTWADFIKIFDDKKNVTKKEFEQILEDYS